MRILSLLLSVLIAIPCGSSAPINLDNKSNLIIKAQTFSNQNGNCASLINCKNVTFEECSFGQCNGYGLYVEGSSDIKLINSIVNNCTEQTVMIKNSNVVTINGNMLLDSKGGVHGQSSSSISISNNYIFNTKGPGGNLVQFDKVNGGGNLIKCNVGINIPGITSTEDDISLYQCNGLPIDYIQVIGNKIIGGGPSVSGGGIMLGDNGGSYQVAKFNILINPGQYGMAVAGGHDMKIENNSIYGKSKPFSNIGLYVWAQNSVVCYNITAQNNEVMYTNKNGVINPAWDGGNCGTIIGWNNNKFYSTLSEQVLIATVPQICLKD